MKKLITALCLGLFVVAGAPVLLHADDAAAGGTSAPATKKAHKAHKGHKAHKKSKKAAAAPSSAAAGDASAK